MVRPFEDHALRKARLCNVFKPDDPASMQILSGFHETFWHGGPIATAGAMILHVAPILEHLDLANLLHT